MTVQASRSDSDMSPPPSASAVGVARLCERASSQSHSDLAVPAPSYLPSFAPPPSLRVGMGNHPREGGELDATRREWVHTPLASVRHAQPGHGLLTWRRTC